MYAREFDGTELQFGVVGVDQGTLIMYDAQTRSRWSQLFGEAIGGEMEGTALEKIGSTMTTWRQWRELHPETTVYVKPSIPYRARFTRETFDEIANQPPGAIRSEDLIIGLEGHIEARAYLVRRMARERLFEDVLENAPIVVYLAPDLATARIFLRTVNGQELSFALDAADHLQDSETGSLWDPITGEAVSGPLLGMHLQPVVSTYSLWFAWAKYRPDTAVYPKE